MKGLVLTFATVSLLLTNSGGLGSFKARQSEFVPDEIIIKVKEGENVVAVAHRVAQEVGGRVIEVSPPYALIRLKSGVDVQSAVTTARKNPKVELAEQNRVIRIPRPVEEIRRFNDSLR